GAKGPGHYSFFFDTGIAPEVGTYIITIEAAKQNFSSAIPNPSLIINIINRPTLLNTNEDVLYQRYLYPVLDSYNFTFEFTDDLTLEFIENADEKTFVLHKRAANGDPIPGSVITGVLYETVDHRYILDLNSENLPVGEYSIVITLNKDNYDFRVAIISLTIVKREFSLLFSVGNRINLDSGENIEFLLTITDLNNTTPVIGVDLTLIIKGIEYSTFTGGITDNNDGTYTVNTFAIAEPFFTAETFIATLSIEKANYTFQTRDFTVVVKIAEIFPGMPTFYFILITASIIGVLGSV
ncbi:unnamed protein product, partial [marine sediment metagenome]